MGLSKGGQVGCIRCAGRLSKRSAEGAWISGSAARRGIRSGRRSALEFTTPRFGASWVGESVVALLVGEGTGEHFFGLAFEAGDGVLGVGERGFVEVAVARGSLGR